MKRYAVLVLIAVLALSGCDALRKLAGRPTGEQVEQLRQQLVAEREALDKARLDSISRAQQQALEDSLEALRLNGVAKSPEGFFAVDYPHSYAIILGSFKEDGNAEKLAATVRAAGFDAEVVRSRNGFNTVCAAPTDDLDEAFKNLKTLFSQAFCPSDAWIIVNK